MQDAYLQYLKKPNRRRCEKFVIAYVDLVDRLVRRVLRDPDLADDATQETFLKLFSRRPDPDSIRAPRAYVLRTAHNAARDVFRGQNARQAHDRKGAEMRSESTPLTDEENLVSAESVRRIYEAIDSLPVELSTIVHLRAGEGLSYREIAKIADVAPNTVGTRLLRAREELRRLLGGTAVAALFTALETARLRGALPRAPAGVSLHLVALAVGARKELSKGATPRARQAASRLGAGGIILGGVIAVSLLLLPEPENQPVRAPAVARQQEPHARVAPPTPPLDAVAEVTENKPPSWRHKVTIAGRILDVRDKTPIANRGLFIAFGDGTRADRMLYLTSDGDGCFSARRDGLLPDSVTIGVSDYASRHVPTPVPTLSEDDVEWDMGDVLLDHGFAVSIVVSTDSGTPMQGASVRNDVSGARANVELERLGESTRTDRTGFWRSGGFSPGNRVGLRVSAEGFSPRTVWIEPLSDTGPIPVILEPAGVIRGVLVDAEERPLPALDLYLRGPGSHSEYLSTWGYGDQPVATTKADGRFRADVPAGRSLWISLERGVFEESIDWGALAPGEILDVGQLRIASASRLVIEVLDKTGNAVRSCRLSVSSDGAPGRAELTASDGSVETSVRRDRPLSISVVDRRFRFDRVARVKNVDALAKNTVGLPALSVTVQRGLRLEGSVRFTDGRLVRDGYVVVKRAADAGSISDYVDRDGRFLLAGLSDPPWTLTASSYSVVQEITLEENPPDGLLDIDLATPPWPRILATVLDENGQPVPDGLYGVHVVIPGIRYFSDSGYCTDGRVHFHGFGRTLTLNFPDLLIHGTPIQLQAIVYRHGRGCSRPVAIPRVQSLMEVTVELEPLAEFEGRVVNDSGEPVAKARVHFRFSPFDGVSSHAMSTSERATYTDGHGVFRLPYLLPGTYEFGIHGPGHGALVPKPVRVHGGESLERVFELPRGGTVQGRVVDQNGNPVADASIYFRPGPLGDVVSTGAGPHSPVTDAEGRFTFDGLPMGRTSGYVSGITVDGEQFEEKFFGVSVSAEEDADIVITVP